MKKKIAILGSTGSIGKSLLKIISKDKKNFEIKLISAKKNYKKLLSQAQNFKVKNIIITDKKYFEIAKSKINKKNINIYNNFDDLKKIFKTKIDYTMSSIVGIDGLDPTFKIIKHTKKLAIANKETIICAWNLINKELYKNKTQFVPVDSEHYSAWYALKNNNDFVDDLYLTASGGPFINYPLSKFKNIKIKDALNHPNWKMGKKITVDSATMMNKVFEIIEAKKIFNLKYKIISIVTHPKSYIHSIIKFKKGLIKIIAHDTKMEIPIFNSLYSENNTNFIKTKKINFKLLNNLNFNKIDYNRFPLVKILNQIPESSSLYETVIVAANDELVRLFLDKKIKFTDISKKLFKFIQKTEFKKYKLQQPKKIQEIIELNKYVRLKINSKSI